MYEHGAWACRQLVVLSERDVRWFSRSLGDLGGDVRGDGHGELSPLPHGKGGAKRMKTHKWLSLVIALLVFASGTAQAATITFTSTADFDAGTKGPTVGGNLGVETVTDNPGMAANAFELGNLKGDAYTTADGDADTAKWDLATGNAETITRSIAGGVLNVGIETLPLGGWAGVASSVSFSGNAEITWKADAITLTNANDMARMGATGGQGVS